MTGVTPVTPSRACRGVRSQRACFPGAPSHGPNRPLLAAALLLSACKNECQQLCNDIADYAVDCGFEFSKEEIKACEDANKGKELNDNTLAVCEETRPFLAEEWSCDEISEYFDTAGGGGSSGGTGGSDGTGGTEARADTGEG